MSLRYFNGNSHFTFFVKHFTKISLLSPSSCWKFSINCFAAISFCSQSGISNSRSDFFTTNIRSGIISDSSLFKSVVKFRMALLIGYREYCCRYCCGYCCGYYRQYCCGFLRLLSSHHWNSILIFEIYVNPLKWYCPDILPEF